MLYFTSGPITKIKVIAVINMLYYGVVFPGLITLIKYQNLMILLFQLFKVFFILYASMMVAI